MNLLRKFMTLALGEGAARALGVITHVVIARSLGVEQFGVFSFAMSIAVIAMVVTDMGQNANITRIISRAGGGKTHLYARATANKLGIGALATVLVTGVMLLAGASGQVVGTIALMMGWASVMGAVEGARAVMRARETMAGDAAITSFESVMRAVATVIAALLGASVVGFGAAFFAEACITAAIVFAVLRGRVRLVPTAEEWKASRTFLREAAGIGLVAIATIGFYRVDQVFILPLAGEAQSGLYGAAARVAFTATAGTSLVAMAVSPRLAAAYRDRAAFGRSAWNAIALAAGAGLLAAVALAVLAEPVMVLLFGVEYAEGAVLLRILAFAVAVKAVGSIGMSCANALHRERKALPRVVVLVVLIALANLVLVPMYGALASAWISVVGELLLMAALLTLSWDMLFGRGKRGEPIEVDEQCV